jgi:hypothetical protein
MRNRLASCAALAAALAFPATAAAHITPNVELVRKGDFLKEALPGAAKFFEKRLMISGPDGAAIRSATGWTPTEEDTRVFVGRDASGGLVGTVVFLWMPSQHGPLGVGVAFGPDGAVRRAAVTDVASEPLAWVRPIVDSGGLGSLAGLARGAAPDAARLAPAGAGAMTRYYAGLVAEAVGRAQRVETVAAAGGGK